MASNNIISQSDVVVWLQPDGEFSAYIPYGVGDKSASMTGKSIPGTTTSPVYGRDAFGRPLLIKQNQEAPGDLPGATISVYEKAQVDILMDALRRGCDTFNVQSRIVRCGRINSVTSWDSIDIFSGGRVGSLSLGDAPALEFDGTSVTNEATITFDGWMRLVQTSLSDLSSGTALDILDLAVGTDDLCGTCAATLGQPNADDFIVLAVAADAGNTLEGTLRVSVDGGSSFSAVSAAPFAATAADYEDATFVAMQPISKTQVRYVVGTGTSVAASKAQIAYADVEYGDETTTSWTVVTVDSSSNADVVQALEWLLYDRGYIAVAGDIYVSTSQFSLDPGSPIYTSSTQINGFTMSPDETEVWAFGASDLILRELDQDGTFSTRVGVGSGNAFTALEVTKDGYLYAGNGTSLFRSTNKALNAGGWVELKDFGTNKVVKEIHAVQNDNQVLRIVVDDSTGSNGQVWLTFDGGATFVQTQELTNTGYNSAVHSVINDNKMFIVGDGGTIQLLDRI